MKKTEIKLVNGDNAVLAENEKIKVLKSENLGEIELIDGSIAKIKDTKDYKALKSKEYNFFFNKKDGYFVRWGFGNGVAEKITKQEKDLYLLWCNIWEEKFNLKQFVSDLQTDSNYFKMVPDILDFEVSTRCDFGCDFCYKSNKDDGEYIKYDDIKPLIEWYKALPNCHKCRDADFPSLEPLFNATCARCLINFKKDKPDLEI